MTHHSTKIREILSGWLESNKIEMIWEIGSRDGLDALELSSTFPSAHIVAFEPNPDTFPLVEKVSLESKGKILCRNEVLSDYDGDIVFHKIDPERTITTWQDGNPGASSMFLANQEYDYEKYAQIEISVRSSRPSSLIENGSLKFPNLIWMDVQGAELLVLKGFGKYLQEVDCIFVELSLRNIYEGQAKAEDVIEHLKPYFFWHSNLTRGKWQFDALFINRKHSSQSLRLRDALLKTSLRLGFRIGISISKGILKRITRRILKSLWLKWLNQLRQKNLPSGGIKIYRAGEMYYEKTRRSLPVFVREMISAAQPNSLDEQNPVEIDVIIPCTKKNILNLNLVLRGVHENCLNPVRKTILITPAENYKNVIENFPELEVLVDEEFISSDLSEMVNAIVPARRKGWVNQQLIKILASIKSDAKGSLVLDADTVLLRPRLWLNESGIQALDMAHEWHEPYMKHAERFGIPSKAPVSFVTHYQLMQTDIIRDLFGPTGHKLSEWLACADFREDSAISEYQTYGSYLMSKERRRVRLTQWNNCSRYPAWSLNSSYQDVKSMYSSYSSISNHPFH